MKRIILALVAIVMALNVSAQELRWGAVGAVNFSWMRAKAAGVAISSDSYIGFQAGAKAEMDLADYLTDGFFADGALVYNLKGGSYSGSHTNLGYLHVFGESMQRFDFGLNYKLGVEMWNQWQFYLGFEHSLLNLAKTDADLGSGVKYRLVNFYIGTSYMF